MRLMRSAPAGFAILMYPVINFTDATVIHAGSRDALTNKMRRCTRSCRRSSMSRGMCRRFSWRMAPMTRGAGDELILFYEACVKAQVQVELHVYENGPHGFGLGATDPSLKTWPDLMTQWLIRNKILK